MERQYEGPFLAPQPAAEPLDGRAGAGRPVLRPLDPRVRLLWWTASALTLVVALVIAFVAGLPLPDGWSGLPALVVFVAGTPLAVLVPWLRYRRWRFALRDDDLWIRRGVLWIHTSVIPFARLQFVDATQGPLDRMFGLARLVVHTAAPGTSGLLPGLATDEAERLRERLSRVRTMGDDG
jgi:membrane protein YdbS with pleckstrin-like domain